MFSACCNNEQPLNVAPVSDDPSDYFGYKGPGPWYTCQPDGEVPPRMAPRGLAGPSTRPATFIELLTEAGTGEKSGAPALLAERPVPPLKEGQEAPPALPREEWKTWTYGDYLRDVQNAAKGMIQLGLQPFQSVNIWGFNAPEWVMSVYAASFAGAKCAGLYPTDTPETAAFKIVHSQGNILVVEDKGKVDRAVKALNARKDAKHLKAIIAWGYTPDPGATVEVIGCGKIPVYSWAALLEIGTKNDVFQELGRRVDLTRAGHCAALIYTSGTTGDPKAVMISHDNIVYEVGVVVHQLAQSVQFGETLEERVLSYLPLSHVAGMLIDIAAPVFAAARRPTYMSVFFARVYDLKMGTLKDRLNVAKPTMFLGVPMVWEKIADKIRALGAQVTGLKKKIATFAKGVALEYAHNIQLGGSQQVPWAYPMMNKLILSKIKANLGLDECRFGGTAAAPIRVDTLQYFGSLGIFINELYGMSECTGACTVSTDQAHVWGACGWQLTGQEVKAFRVDPQDLTKKVECPKAPSLDAQEETYQGELCFRGRNVMMGYLACPDMGADHLLEIDKKTRESIDGEGWLHSGDKGLVTQQGLVKITGRYKELIIGEGGENIAPVPIEDEVKRLCDGLAEVMMVGDRRKYNVAIVTLKAVGANGEVPGTDQLDAGAKRVNPAVKTITEAIDDKVWIDAITAAITATNNNGKCCPNQAFKIQKFSILPINFSEEKGELTPTKKLKRKAVETAYAAVIDRLYAVDGTYIRYQAK